MSEKEPISLYVSHVFHESDDYLRFFEYLESVDNFFYTNCAKPDEMPKGSPDEFKNALLEQIKPAEIVIILGTLYERKREWVSYQIEVAKARSLPVICVNAFGATVVLSRDLLEKADAIVDWNEREIVDAIRQHARGEDTNRWEVIDFP